MIDLDSIARATDGRVDGDGAFAVRALHSLESARGDSLAFYAGSPKRAERARLRTTAAGAVMLRAADAALFARHKVIVADPYLAYARASALFAPRAPTTAAQVHPSAIVAADAVVHADAAVAAGAVIGARAQVAADAVIGAHVTLGDDCVIGRGSVLEPGARIHARTRIGAHCRIASGAVIGASGFGYAQGADGAWLRIEQLGGVRIGDHVDVGANTTIDRGALDDTVIGDGVKLDNQIQIAHNVRIGAHTIMAGCVAIAGSAVIGARCRFGGRAAVLGHLQIADDVVIHADSLVTTSIDQPGVYSATLPAQPAAQWRRTAANLRRLDSLAKKVGALAAGGKAK